MGYYECMIRLFISILSLRKICSNRQVDMRGLKQASEHNGTSLMMAQRSRGKSTGKQEVHGASKLKSLA